MTCDKYKENKIKIAICITFYFKECRIKFLIRLLDSISASNYEFRITVITNNNELERNIVFCSFLNKKNIKIEYFIPYGLGHSFLLTWSHLHVFRNLYCDESFTHFLYSEDDLMITKENIDYWLNHIDILKPLGFFPSFLRIEINSKNLKTYTSDVINPISQYDCNFLKFNNQIRFVNIPYAYQGCYFYDRDLMNEHLSSSSSNPDFIHSSKSLFKFNSTNIREKAAFGLTFFNTPPGYWSRCMIKLENGLKISESALIHHMPNNLCNDTSTPLGKIELSNLFLRRSVKNYFKFLVKKVLKLFFKIIISRFSTR